MFPSGDCGWNLSCLLVANFSPLHRVSVSFLGHSGDDVNRSSPPVTPVTTEQSPESPIPTERVRQSGGVLSHLGHLRSESQRAGGQR